jgi:hypothetical protein
MTDRYESGEIARAEIINLQTNKRIKCMFNPQEYKISKGSGWSSEKARGQDNPHSEYSGGAPNSLSLNLTFDTYESHAWFKNTAREDVRNYTKDLWELALINKSKTDAVTNQGKPPECRFVWGTLWSFVGVVISLTQTFTLFLHDGTPVRAKVDITFQQTTDDGAYPGQNPTSGGEPNARVYVVTERDTLAGIAYAMYRDSTVWRHLAEANNIDDPLGLRPGQRLLITSLSLQ